MYEQLSRLLAGELDPTAEAALRGRIAEDPALARAWADLSALPDLLGGMAFEAPPPALAARLAEQTAAHAFDADDHRADDWLDTGSLDRDWLQSADDTLDPEADAVRGRLPPARRRALARAPTSPQGREAFLDRLLAEARMPASPLGTSPGTPPVSRSRPTPAVGPGRRFGVTAVIAAIALAAGVVVGLQGPAAYAPPVAPTEIALSEGTTTIDGAAHLRAGDVRVRIDGRAHVTVEPGTSIHGAAGVVIVGSAAAVVADPGHPEAAAELRYAASPAAGPVADAAPSPTRFDGTGAPVASAARVQDPGVQTLRVTVEVERGSAVVDGEGAAVAMAAGESRAFAAHPVEIPRPREGSGAPSTGTVTVPTLTIAEEQKDITRRTVTLSGGLTRGDDADHLDLDPDLGPDARMYAALEAVPGAELLDVDCSSRPCVAIYDYVGDDPAWRDALGEALAEGYDGGVVLLGKDLEVDGGPLGLAVVSLDERKPRGVHGAHDGDGDRDRRIRGALADIERELSE